MRDTETERHQLEAALMGNHLSSQSGLPLIRKPRQRDHRGRKREHVGAIICFLHPLSVCWRERGGGNWEAGAGASSFFHAVLPGAVQFLDSSLAAPSRLLLSGFCSNLLPPCRLRSSSPWPETPRSGTRLSWSLGCFRMHFQVTSHVFF